MGAISRTSRIGRIAGMGKAELLDRLRQYVTARADLLRYRIGFDFDPQSSNGAPDGQFFFSSADIASVCDALKRVFPAEADDIVLRAENICRHKFNLLGYENLEYGAEIDWHLDVVHRKRAPREPWFRVKYLD